MFKIEVDCDLMSNDLLNALVEKAFRREVSSRPEALALLSDSETLIDVVAAGARVRREFSGARVKLNTIINMKSGL